MTELSQLFALLRRSLEYIFGCNLYFGVNCSRRNVRLYFFFWVQKTDALIFAQISATGAEGGLPVVWSWSNPWHLRYRRSALYHLSQRLTTLMNVHLYFSYWVQKTNAQISIIRTAAMPVLELTKIIPRKFLLFPLRSLIPAPPNAFLLRDIGELRVTSEFSLFVFLFSDSSIYPGSDTNH